MERPEDELKITRRLLKEVRQERDRLRQTLKGLRASRANRAQQLLAARDHTEARRIAWLRGDETPVFGEVG